MVLLAGVVGMLILSVVLATIEGEFLSLHLLLDLGLTAIFAVFLFSPAVAVALLTAMVVIAVLLGWLFPAFTALIVATGVVARSASAWVMVAFVGVLLSVAAVAVLQRPEQAAVTIGMSLLVSVVVGAVGVLLRVISGREHRLHAKLREQAAIIKQIHEDERLAIADELHDVIAHDLTAIAMQARMLDHETDTRVRAQTQREIGYSARRALRDIRRLIAPRETVAPSRIDDIAAVVNAMSCTLTSAGFEVDVDFGCEARSLPRLLDVTLSRVVRESVTNVLKHSTAGPVVIRARSDDSRVCVEIRNRRAIGEKRDDLPSGGYGTARLQERVGLLGGEFSAAPVGDEWVVRASLPLT